MVALSLSACTIAVTRPTQEMSDTAASIRAAREVQADVKTPELYREATEWFFKARQEYQLKNFSQATDYLHKAQVFAEQAEYESLRVGGQRESIAPPPPAASAPSGSDPGSAGFATPQPTPADVYDQRKAQDDAAQAASEKASRANSVGGGTNQANGGQALYNLPGVNYGPAGGTGTSAPNTTTTTTTTLSAPAAPTP